MIHNRERGEEVGTKIYYMLSTCLQTKEIKIYFLQILFCVLLETLRRA